MNQANTKTLLSKVPHVALAFWIIKICATTLGETAGDALSMTLELGYVKSSVFLFCGVIFILFLWHRVAGQIQFEGITTRRNETFYWVTIRSW